MNRTEAIDSQGAPAPIGPKLILFAWCRTSSVAALDAAGVRPLLVVTGMQPPALVVADCSAASVVLERCPDVNAPQFVERLRALGADLILVVGCPRVLRSPVLASARWGAINFHPSLLPHYRGRQPLFWALLNGEPRVGVTVHRMTDAIDAGPVLLQREVSVPAGATSASLAERVDDAVRNVVPAVVAWMRAGAMPAGHVAKESGSYYPPLRERDGVLDWARPSVEIDRRVRACSGEIDAYSYYRGLRIIVREACVLWGKVSVPGAIVSADDRAFVVATADGALRVTSWELTNGLQTADELAAWFPLEIGARLGNPPPDAHAGG